MVGMLIFMLITEPAIALVLPQREGKFFSLSAARAGKPGGMKIANADDRFMGLGSYSMRRGSSSSTAQGKKHRNAQRKPEVISPTASDTTSQEDEARRQKLAEDIVGDTGEKVKADRKALQILFPSLTGEEEKPASPERTSFLWPLEPALKQRISSRFGNRKDPFTGKPAFHKGIDIATPMGTKVLACADGRVETVATHPRLGKYVKVEHEDGSHSLYGHLSATHVQEGKKIKAGAIIGNVGSTGRSTGPHLDFSYRRDGEAVDPLPFLSLPAHIKTLELSDASR